MGGSTLYKGSGGKVYSSRPQYYGSGAHTSSVWIKRPIVWGAVAGVTVFAFYGHSYARLPTCGSYFYAYGSGCRSCRCDTKPDSLQERQSTRSHCVRGQKACVRTARKIAFAHHTVGADLSALCAATGNVPSGSTASRVLHGPTAIALGAQTPRATPNTPARETGARMAAAASILRNRPFPCPPKLHPPNQRASKSFLKYPLPRCRSTTTPRALLRLWLLLLEYRSVTSESRASKKDLCRR